MPTAAVRSSVATAIAPRSAPAAAAAPGLSFAFSRRQENRFNRPGASSASKTTRLRHSTLRLLSSFSACAGRGFPFA